MYHKKNSLFFLILCIGVFLFTTSNFAFEKETVRGDLEGKVYLDGTTPLQGATVRVKNISSGTEYMSEASGHDGSFLISNVEKGFYVYEVTTREGDSMPGDYFGMNVKDNESANIAFNVSPLEKFDSSEFGENTRLGRSSLFSGDSHIVFPDELVMDVNCWTPVSPCQTTVFDPTKLKEFISWLINWEWN